MAPDGFTVTAPGLNLTQTAHAKGIIAAVHALGWPSKAAVIAVEAALAESGMRMIASANVPVSQKYPHDYWSGSPDGLGHDHASMGMFQQQTGYAWTPAGYGWNMNQTTMNSPNGWGTPAELMNAQASTAKFLAALARVNWRGMSNWMAAQSVQGSAFADGSNYRAEDTHATQIVSALWAAPVPTRDWFDMATKAELAAVINAAIDAKMSWWLPRMLLTLRKGTGNKAFGVVNSGATLIDGRGVDGTVNGGIAAVEHSIGILYRGDGGPDATNTHPDNLHMIRESIAIIAADVKAIKTKVGI